MPVTERVVVLMSPAEKEVLEAKAANAGGISSAELVRRAVEAYDEGAAEEAAELRNLLGVLAVQRAETLRKLEATERKLEDTLAYLQEQDQSSRKSAA